MILDTNERFTICRPENLQGWLKERTNGIGASELSSILGLNKYCTPLQYFTKKRNEIECAAAGVENHHIHAAKLWHSQLLQHFGCQE